MGSTGVPITLQTLGVMLAGGILGARKGFLSVLVFLVLVSAGLPLLAGRPRRTRGVGRTVRRLPDRLAGRRRGDRRPDRARSCPRTRSGWASWSTSSAACWSSTPAASRCCRSAIGFVPAITSNFLYLPGRRAQGAGGVDRDQAGAPRLPGSDRPGWDCGERSGERALTHRPTRRPAGRAGGRRPTGRRAERQALTVLHRAAGRGPRSGR